MNSLTYEDLGSAAQRDRRRRILDATVSLASKGGFDAVQMRAVAELADVALGTLYRYFPSKIHLLVSALARQFEETEANLGLLELTGKRRDEQMDLGGEVAVERAEGDVGQLGDGPHLDGVEPALGRQRDGGVEDAATPVALRGRPEVLI